MSHSYVEHVKYIISRPALGAGGKTGSWRVNRPVINYEKCNGCGICWLYCPENAIDWLEDKSVRINYDYCKGCGICLDVCPLHAIVMVKERVV